MRRCENENAVSAFIDSCPYTVEHSCFTVGYLKKYRGMLQTRSRWFTLTSERLLYYAHEAGMVEVAKLLLVLSN